VTHGARDLEVGAREDGQAEHARVLLHRRADDLRDRPADAAVDHLEAGVARGDRDHLGAVRVPVEAGLPDHHARTPAVTRTPGRDPPAHGVDPFAVETEALPLDTRRRTILAE